MMAIFIVMGSQADLPRWPDETGADQMKQAEVLYYRGMVIMM